MNPYEKIKDLTRQEGISVRELEKRLGYSNGYFSKWKTVSPNSDGLSKVADYFNVSIDYLVGREKNNNTSFASDDLNKILDNAKSFDGKPITENDKEAIRLFLEGRMSK
ncbi:helix-turn-helix domain-containing protein [Enterococcus thailandicus]|uniref:helix-turn-helix domain-containing protein n=1 Tax=Enterococcus thailandicus TaxID=417368 RepID=UPI00288EBA9B|nr:helix-turn-helix transcriptional regulator [Enterococcus thailandicus]MDT2752701.1 helix-turn-helix transcriptional regulator [Enterococcus thailandicus]MDT2776099.1 helix-turn-helix transcriptional regulator [Enterococcus thailandicus]